MSQSYSGGENGSISEEDLVTSSSTSSLDSEEETSFGDVMIYQVRLGSLPSDDYFYKDPHFNKKNPMDLDPRAAPFDCSH